MWTVLETKDLKQSIVNAWNNSTSFEIIIIKSLTNDVKKILNEQHYLIKDLNDIIVEYMIDHYFIFNACVNTIFNNQKRFEFHNNKINIILCYYSKKYVGGSTDITRIDSDLAMIKRDALLKYINNVLKTIN